MFRRLLCNLGFHDWIYELKIVCNSFDYPILKCRKRHCNYCYRQEEEWEYEHKTKFCRVEDYNPIIDRK